MPLLRRRSAVFSALLASLLTLPLMPVASPAQADTPCTRMGRADVPGAQHQVTACLDDLTTAGTVASGHTDAADWAGLQLGGHPQPERGAGRPDRRLLPGHLHVQHHPRLEPRLPVRDPAAQAVERRAGGRGGAREPRQYANDFTISDWVLAKGYAYASTDKGNVGRSSTRTAGGPATRSSSGTTG